MKKAIAKKSGKEFTIVEETEVSVVLRNLENGEEKEIKRSTLSRGYDILEISEKVQETQPEGLSHFASVEKLMDNAVKGLMKMANALEEGISDLADMVVVEVEFTDGVKDVIRVRDNARQCYKENENRFRKAQEEYSEILKKIDNDSENKYLKEAYQETDKALKSYVEKMCYHYKKYIVAKDHLEDLRKKNEESSK